MILEAWDIELEWVHSFAIILSENDTVFSYLEKLLKDMEQLMQKNFFDTIFVKDPLFPL